MGPLGQFPLTHRYCNPCHPSPPASFPSPSDTACRLNIRSVFPGRRTQDRPGSDHRLFPSGFSSGNGRVSQVPGEPTACMPCSSTPAGPEGVAVLPPDVAFRQPEAVGSREYAISELNSRAYKLPVYASRPGLLLSAQHSVPAVSTLGRTGLVTRRVPKKVSALHASSFSRLGLAHQAPATVGKVGITTCLG